MFGLNCTVYMRGVDFERQKFNVFCMNTLGDKVVLVQDHQRTLKDAINKAMRYFVKNFCNTHYLIGNVVGDHTFPTTVRCLLSIIDYGSDYGKVWTPPQ